MEAFIWFARGVLALLFIVTGMMKILQTKEKLSEKMDWVDDFSSGTLKFVGVVELIGALGLILPFLFDFPKSIVSFSAVGLAVVQFLALGVHFKRKENISMVFNIVLLILSLFVAFYSMG